MQAYAVSFAHAQESGGTQARSVRATTIKYKTMISLRVSRIGCQMHIYHVKRYVTTVIVANGENGK